MSIASRCRAWVRMVRDRDRFDADLDREVRTWRQELVDRYVATGMTLTEARRRAAIEVGGDVQLREAVHDARGGQAVDVLWRELTQAARASTLQSRPTAPLRE
jgi:hypothetical protein